LKGHTVSKELSLPILPGASETAAQRLLRVIGIALAGSVLVAVCAHIALPLFFTPVPLTLQPFAVLVLGLLLSPRLAFAALVAYLAEGALGLPVFTPGALAVAGVAHLLGPTGGYLLSYPLAAPAISFLYRRTQRSYLAALACAAAGNLLILSCGALWFAVFARVPAPLALTQAVVPFLPGDALKVAAAAGVAFGFVRMRQRAS
jgi:biotin transport system substrate-specific component